MRFLIDLTEEEYDILMKKFGKYGCNDTDGARGAVKRLIRCIPEFEDLVKNPIKSNFSREIYRDSDIVITMSSKDGVINNYNC